MSIVCFLQENVKIDNIFMLTYVNVNIDMLNNNIFIKC